MKNLRFYIVFLFVLIALLLCACTDYAQKIKDEFDPDDASMAANEIKEISYGYMTDDRDGQEYRTVKIAGQEWMAQNLNYYIVDTYCYDDNYQNCDTYGRLYKWDAALYACPAGWHLPTKEEIDILIKNVGDRSTAATVLKYTKLWDDGGNGTDSFGFGALPGGLLGYEGYFDGIGLTAGFWSSTEGDNDTLADYLIMRSDYDEVRLNQGSKNYGYSIRCLYGESDLSSSSLGPKSSSSQHLYGEFFDDRDSRTYKTIEIGSQTWMAENLRFEMDDSYCYDDDMSYCEKYGRLYVWTAAQDACPDGWHLPSPEEFDTLLATVGNNAAEKLMATNSWIDSEGKNSFGFSALPGGFRGNSGNYSDEGSMAFFWSNAKASNGTSGYNLIIDRFGDASIHGEYDSADGNSVRCIMNGEGFSSSSSAGSSSSSIVFYPDDDLFDDRDGQTYRTVTIESQTWMAQNLNFVTENSLCYNDDESSCDTYGRLYKWQDAQLACPYGWHLPSKDEFETLITVAGGYEIAGKTLKSTTGWWDTGKGEGGTDDFGFTVLPAGYINTNEAFISKTAVTLFWTSSVNVDRVYTLSFSYSDDTASMFLNDTKESKSIRCIRD